MFRWWVGDHGPRHVHILRDGRRIGRWDVGARRPMDPFELTGRLERALKKAGFWIEEER